MPTAWACTNLCAQKAGLFVLWAINVIRIWLFVCQNKKFYMPKWQKERKEMKKMSLYHELKNNAYPGRGIIIGRSKDGKTAVMAYFIMGRSSNSRNRVFVEDGEGIRTQAFDPSKLEDPSLIIYAPVRVMGNQTIVTNGDQTDTIYEKMSEGLTFEQALRTREFEPDGDRKSVCRERVWLMV